MFLQCSVETTEEDFTAVKAELIDAGSVNKDLDEMFNDVSEKYSLLENKEKLDKVLLKEYERKAEVTEHNIKMLEDIFKFNLECEQELKRKEEKMNKKESKKKTKYAL